VQRSTLTRASIAVAAAAAGATLTVVALPAHAQEQTPAKPSAPATLAARAATAADQLIQSPAAAAMLRRAPRDTLTRTDVFAGTRGLQYVTYQRRYAGLPVVGGDVVVAADANGALRGTAVAQNKAIAVSTTAKVTAAAALATARRKLAKVDSVSTANLSILTWTGKPTLVYEAVVAGRTAKNVPSRLHVFVDANKGTVVDSYDDVKAGDGNGFFYGAVTIGTTHSGSTYTMNDPGRPGLKCGNQSGTIYSGSDDVWGNGSATNLETACVDTMYSAEQEIDMLRSWFGRNGIEGNGTNVPLYVGLADVNAFWDGSSVNIGHNQANNRELSNIDVVAHEQGHAIFQYTPGGSGSSSENKGLNESFSDIWGALTEAYANNPKDTPDYTVGELVNLVGSGPIRYMYKPSLIAGHPDCYSSSLPAEEHAGAGPMNHFFYLIAEGTNPTDGQPASPTCNSSTITGLGIRKAGEIFYNAELMKTSSWKYPNVRTATLTAAKNLYPGSCAEFNVVKAAWDAIKVPAQSADPTCSGGGGTNDFTIAVSPTSGTVAAGSSATATVSTAVTTGNAQTVALSASGLPSGATASFNPASVSAGASSTLTISTSASTPAGTYQVTITGKGAATHTATYSLTVSGGGGPGGCSGTNGNRVDIPDAGAAVTSTITISGCSRAPSASSKVAVNIVHPYRGDLVVKLIAPDGSSATLKRSNVNDDAANVNATYTVDASDDTANGAWKLSVQDLYRRDVGYIASWTLTL
jgi:Zn-dependent metalloprotease